MNTISELPFRITLGALVLVGFALRSYYQRRTQHVARVSQRFQRRDRFFYSLVTMSYLPMLLYVSTKWMDFAHFDLPGWVRWAGAATLAGGVAFAWWAHAVLGKNWSGILELSADHSLVTDGPYRWVRHPMYSAFFVIGLGVLLLSANWLISAAYLVSVAWMYHARVRSEEEMMVERFGETYRAYMDRTWRLFPRFSK